MYSAYTIAFIPDTRSNNKKKFEKHTLSLNSQIVLTKLQKLKVNTLKIENEQNVYH